MMAEKSSLNANAAVYIPLSKRGAVGDNQEQPLTATGSESRVAAAGFESHPVNYQSNKAFSNYHNTWKRTDSHGSYASSSKSPKAVSHKDFLDEESDMDLAYLQMTFPDYSDESLSHIYLANGGDLEFTVEMLSQLELGTDDGPEFLPDPLEIGSTSESQSSKEGTSLNLKEVVDEIAGSSGSSNEKSIQN